MFSARVPSDLAANRLTRAVAHCKEQARRLIDLTESNPTRAGFEYPPDLLAPLAHPRGLLYEPQPFGRLDARAAVSADYARRGLVVEPGHIALTASSSESYSLLFKILCNAGDEVLVPRPSYPLFDHLARLDEVVVRPYDLEYHARWSVDVGSLLRHVSPRTRAILIVSPNNPTGSFVTASELDELATVCVERSLALIADEVFADYELTAGTAAAAGRVVERTDILAFSLGGLSKTIGLPQVKLGWIAVTGPVSLTDPALLKLELACDTYLSVSTPVQAAAGELLAGGSVVRRQIQDRTRVNLQMLGEFLATCAACRLLRAEGGWYAVLQVPTLEPEEDLVVRLVEREGVLVHPGYFFDFPRESYLVVSLLTEPAVFRDGITRVLRHFDCRAQ